VTNKLQKIRTTSYIGFEKLWRVFRKGSHFEGAYFAKGEPVIPAASLVRTREIETCRQRRPVPA